MRAEDVYWHSSDSTGHQLWYFSIADVVVEYAGPSVRVGASSADP